MALPLLKFSFADIAQLVPRVEIGNPDKGYGSGAGATIPESLDEKYPE